MNGNAAARNIVAVTDAQKGQAGAIVLWRLSGAMDADKLRAAWAARGLPEHELPAYPSVEVALRRAVQEHRSQKMVVHSIPSRGGYALVDVREVRDDKAHPLNLTVGLVVRLNPRRDELEFSEPEHRLAAQIRADFQANCRCIEAEDTGLWLADLVKRLGCAVPLRDTGGTYFVPQETVALWGDVTASVREASATYFAEIPAMQSSKAVAAILDAITREAAGQLEGVEADLQDALAERGGMGKRAIQTRLTAVASLESKLATYEGLLDMKLVDLRGRLVGLRANLAASALATNAPSEDA